MIRPGIGVRTGVNESSRSGKESRQVLDRRRADVWARIESLEQSVAEVVAASADSNADDEHDPEGSTIAFEREQVSALLIGARLQLREIDAALARLAEGTYGRCLGCGRQIGEARLAARPWAADCIACAGRR